MAISLDTYNKTPWAPGMPITQERMSKVENGIYDNREAIKELDDNLHNSTTGVIASINNINSTIGQHSQGLFDNQSLWQAIAALSSSTVDATLGRNAWTQISGVIGLDQLGNVTKNLSEVLGEIRSQETDDISAIKVMLGKNSDTTDVFNNANTVASNIESIWAALGKNGTDNIFSNINTVASNFVAINDQLEKGGYTSFRDRITAISTKADSAYSKADAVKSEIEDAHRTLHDGSGTPLEDSLRLRFEDLESSITSSNSDISDIRQEINEAHIVINSVTSTLDGRFDAIDGGTAPTRTLPSIITEINNAHRSTVANDTLNQRFNSIDNLTAEITNAHRDTVENDTLDNRFDAIETRIGTTESNITSISASSATLAGRVTAAETAITTLNGDASTTGSVINTVNTQVATMLADAPEAFNTLQEIAEWLGTHSDDALTMQQNISANAASITTLQNAISDTATGLAAIKDIADAAASAASVSAITTRVEALEGKDTIVISNPSVGSNYTNGKPNSTAVQTPSTSADYLIQNDEDDKYYYWRYINNDWELISGAGGGGTGTSSAEFYASVTSVTAPSETVDYFIGSNNNYIHYRYLNGTLVPMLPAHLINSVTVDTSPISDEEGAATKSKPIIKEIGSDTNLLNDFHAIQTFSATAVTAGYELTWTNIDGETESITITGGSGSGVSVGDASITRVGNANLLTIAGETCIINYRYNAVDSQGQTLAATPVATWYVNRARVATSDVTINDDITYNTFDISPYLQIGTNNISVSISVTIDDVVITRTKTWTAEVKNFSLEWNYDESTINSGSTIDFLCTPYGTDITKTLHIKVGTDEETQTITTSGIPVTVSLDNTFEHGVYTAEMYMTATINGQSKETPHIYHDFIVAEVGNNAPIIAATLPSSSMEQYNTITIPFVVYTPNSNYSTVTLAVDGTTIDTRENVGRTTQTWHYTPSTAGAKVLTITSGTTTKTLNLTVNSVNITNEEVPGYVFKLKASDLASNTALQNWYYDDSNPTTTKLQFSNNFDWINGGLQTELDENNEIRQYIRVKSGTTMTIPYKMFASDPRINGADFKIIFKIDNCRNYDAVAMTNMDYITDENDELVQNIGIQLDAHRATFKSNATMISTQYGEEEYTELEFEVYKALTNNGTAAPDQYMMAWVDGVMSTARKYGGNFVQTTANAKDIVIGANDCDICIYLVKYYPFALNRNDHITNFIADAPNGKEMINRYNRNDILDEAGDIDYNKLAQKNRDCRVWLYDISRMTKAKDDSIDVYNFQQIWENGDTYYQLSGTNAKLKIQGTSSVNYRYGAANTDIDFGKKKAPNATLVDGYGHNLLDSELEYPGFKINDNSLPITYSNTKVNFASCEQVNNMCNAEWYQRYQPFPSLSARDCMEFAMGVQFIKDRHENEPEDGIPLFTEKSNFNSEKYYMYSIANMGTSKKNTHIFHSENECCIEIKENTSNAQKMKSFDSAWTDNDANVQNYEMRYPDVKNTKVPTDIRDGWARFVQWMAANNPGAALEPDYIAQELSQPVTFEPYTFRGHNREVTETTGRNFKQVLRGVTVSQYAGTYDHDTFEYRMAKMLSECEDYMAMDSVVYHFCFIERHTMVDNVAKNTFWSSVKEVGGPNDEEGYWIWDLSKNYDNDTSDGNNNNGLLVFDYGNEATDTREGTPVFNGHDAVWFVFVSNLYEACRAMFTDRENLGAWSSVNYHNYLLGEQKKVPERVWNECYWYDYLRTYEAAIADPDNENLDPLWIGFLDGGQKTHQRKHYETYEEIYDSSKYRGGFAHNQAVVLRGEAIDYQTLGLPAQESEFNITMFNKCYLTIWIGPNYQTVKCQKGVPVTISFYEDNDPSKGYMSLSNSVIEIDSGSMIQAIGDLSLIYPSSGQFATAKRLRSLQIGSDVTGYYNPNMNTNTVLTFNNRMLEYLYVQNLPQATYNLDLSNCPELKYLNAAGSGFTGFVFANGGLLNEAYINNPTSLVMRNLDYLTNANFNLTSPTAVTSLRLEGGKLFDNYTFVNSLTNLNVLRLTNINWTLNNDNLLDRLITIMGIDESGFTTEQSYLSGNVQLTGTVYEGKYNAYSAAWSPDLIIDATHANPFIYQHLVTYYNEDGTKLYEYYVNNGDQLVDIKDLLDPEAITKASDVQYKYTFGELNNMARYIPFSGWRLSSGSQSIYRAYGSSTPNITVTGAMQLYAVYTSSLQSYQVRWLLRANQVVKVTDTPQNYGTGYNLIAPTIAEVQAMYPGGTYEFTANGNNCTYRIMSGWDKTPANIAPTSIGETYDIYATWIERTNIPYTTVLASNEYSVAEKLLVLKGMSNARNSLSVGDNFPITLGYNGAKPAIELVSSPRYFDGTSEQINTYSPFLADKSFTMAIDFKFDYITTGSNITEAILLSCYEESNSSAQGFRLSYNPYVGFVPQISFGSTASVDSHVQTIGETVKNRHMVVLRHRANESLLYIYCGSDAQGLIGTYSAAAFRKSITNSAISSGAKIVLGGMNNKTALQMNALGTLYSVKYWEEDLGESECLQLASWCHETINFKLADFEGNSNSSSRNATLQKNLVLHTTNASSMGTISEAQIVRGNESIGWHDSTIHDFYNTRIYQAFPIDLQSILTPAPVPYKKAYYQSSGYQIGQDMDIANDYVFAPSCIELGLQNEAVVASHSIEASGAFGWNNTIKVKQYTNGVFEDGTSDAKYANIRFPYTPNKLNATVTAYIDYPSIGSSFYEWAAQNSVPLSPGDILIPSNSSVAYIYVSPTDIEAGAPVITNTDGIFSGTIGGWIESVRWTTRSVTDSSASPSANKFYYIQPTGDIVTGNEKTVGLVYSIAL